VSDDEIRELLWRTRRRGAPMYYIVVYRDRVLEVVGDAAIDEVDAWVARWGSIDRATRPRSNLRTGSESELVQVYVVKRSAIGPRPA
jgi:hypothetical protein